MLARSDALLTLFEQDVSVNVWYHDRRTSLVANLLLSVYFVEYMVVPRYFVRVGLFNDNSSSRNRNTASRSRREEIRSWL